MDQQLQQSGRTRKSSDIQKAELERKKRDLYKIFNPTNQPHQIVLNAAIAPEIWTVESHDEAIVPLYVAEKYFEEMSQKIITAKSDKAVIDENEKLQLKVGRKMDLHTEQARFESKNLKVMMSKRDQIIKILNRGLYKEYGIDAMQNQVIDRRTQRETFDPGVDIGAGSAPVNTAPVNPPQGTGTPAPDLPQEKVTPQMAQPQPETYKVTELPDEPESASEVKEMRNE